MVVAGEGMEVGPNGLFCARRIPQLQRTNEGGPRAGPLRVQSVRVGALVHLAADLAAGVLKGVHVHVRAAVLELFDEVLDVGDTAGTRS